jgi:hypothetical protein
VASFSTTTKFPLFAKTNPNREVFQALQLLQADPEKKKKKTKKKKKNQKIYFVDQVSSEIDDFYFV